MALAESFLSGGMLEKLDSFCENNQDMKKIFNVCLLLCFVVSVVRAQDQVGSQWKLERTIKSNSTQEIAASPTSPLLAARTVDNVTLYDSDTGKQYARLFSRNAGAEYDVANIQFSSDGSFLAAGLGTGEAGAVAFFDVKAKKITHIQETASSPMAIAFSPSGRFLAYSCRANNGTYIEVLDRETNRVVQHLKGIRYYAGVLAWPGNDEVLVSAGGGPLQPNASPLQQSEYARWDLNSGQMLSHYFLSPGGRNVAFNHNTTLLATVGAGIENSGQSTPVTVFRLSESDEEPKQVTQLLANNCVNTRPCMKWSPDSKLLAILHGDVRNGNLLLWDGHQDTSVTSRIAIGGELKPDGPPVFSVTFWPTGKQLASYGSGQISIWTKKEAE